MVQVEVISEIGSNPHNEDAYVVDKEAGVFSVIDGATGLGGLPGKIASETLSDALTKDASSSQSLLDWILQGNEKLRWKTEKELNIANLEEIPKEKRSTCGIAAVQLNNTHINYVHAGDCMFFLKYKNGEVRAITRDPLMSLDNIAIEMMNNILNQKLSKVDDYQQWDAGKVDSFLKEVKSEIHQQLVHNRRKLNTPDGYGIVDGSNEVKKYIESGSIPLQNVSSILLLSDGLQLHENTISDGQSIWLKTAIFAFEHGVEQLKNHIILQESEDRICKKYPRLKPADDKTGILIKL